MVMATSSSHRDREWGTTRATDTESESVVALAGHVLPLPLLLLLPLGVCDSEQNHRPPCTDYDMAYFHSYAHLGIHQEMIK
ncbi:hypothetical protein SESBI_28812, partial [Sesbania bispinosa]